MLYAAAWVLALAALLSLVAFTSACGARFRRPWVHVTLPALAAFVPLLAGALAATVAFQLHAAGGRPSRLVYFISWWIAGAAGSVLVTLRALRARDSAPGVPARASFATAGFFAAFLASSAVLWFVLAAVERAVRVQFSALAARELEHGRSLVRVAVPDGENAAPLYQQAFAAMGNPMDWPVFVESVYSRPDFDPARAEVRAFLAEQESALASIRAAATRPRCAFPEGERSRSGVDVGMWLRLHRLQRLLCVEALRKVADQELDGALADLKSLRSVAEHARDVPLLVGEVIAQVCVLQYARAVEKALNMAERFPSADLGGWQPVSLPDGRFRFEADGALALGSALSILLPHPARGMPDTPRALAVSAAFDELTGKEVGAGVPWLLRGGLRARYYRVFVLPGEVAAYQDGMESWRSLAAKPTYLARSEAEALAVSRQVGRFQCLTFFAACKRILQSSLEMAALEECLRLALAADAFRQRTGRYPSAVADLVPGFLGEPPVDPVDGRPLRIETVDGGLILHGDGAGQSVRLGSAYEEEARKAAAKGPIDYARVSSAEDAEE